MRTVLVQRWKRRLSIIYVTIARTWYVRGLLKNAKTKKKKREWENRPAVVWSRWKSFVVSTADATRINNRSDIGVGEEKRAPVSTCLILASAIRTDSTIPWVPVTPSHVVPLLCSVNRSNVWWCAVKTSNVARNLVLLNQVPNFVCSKLSTCRMRFAFDWNQWKATHFRIQEVEIYFEGGFESVELERLEKRLRFQNLRKCRIVEIGNSECRTFDNIRWAWKFGNLDSRYLSFHFFQLTRRN